MTSLTLTTLDGGKRAIGNGALQALQQQLDGPALTPGKAGYDEARATP